MNTVKKGRASSEKDLDVVSGGRIGHKKSDWLGEDIYTVYDNLTHRAIKEFRGKGALGQALALDKEHNYKKKWKTLDDLEGFDKGNVQPAYEQRPF